MPIAELIQSIRASPNDAQGQTNTSSAGREQHAAPSAGLRGNLAARSTVSSLLGPRMGSGLMGAQQLAVIRDLKRKKEAAEMAEVWLKRQSLLLEGDEMDQAMDEEFEKADEAEEQARLMARPVLVWCNKKAGVMSMQGQEGRSEIICLCDECSAEDEPLSMDPKDFCLHCGLKDKGRWKEAISVDQKHGKDNEEDYSMDQNEWRAILQDLSPPKPGELPKLGAWMQTKALGDGEGSAAAIGGSGEPSSPKEPRSSKKRRQSKTKANIPATSPAADLNASAIQLPPGFVDPDYQSLLETLNQTLSAANAAKLLTKPASTVQGSGGAS